MTGSQLSTNQLGWERIGAKDAGSYKTWSLAPTTLGPGGFTD